MNRTHATLASIALVLACLACDEGTGTPTVPLEETAPLAFDFPRLASPETPSVADPGPQATTAEEVDAIRAAHPFGEVRNPSLKISVGSSGAMFVGAHGYIGNVANLVINGNLAWQGKLVASVAKESHSEGPLVTGFIASSISDVLKISSDKTCGLEASGSAVHSAYFRVLTPTEVRWGLDVETSVPPSSRNARCGQGAGGGSAVGVADPPGIACTYYITYDMNTGVIYAWTLLYCNSTGGGDDLL